MSKKSSTFAPDLKELLTVVCKTTKFMMKRPIFFVP